MTAGGTFSLRLSLWIAALGAAVAIAETAYPFAAIAHAWWFALAAALGAVYLLAGGLLSAWQRGRAAGAMAQLGGALLCATIALASFVAGQTQRVPAVPGQAYKPSFSSRVALLFPEVALPVSAATAWPQTVTILDGARTIAAQAGDTVRAGPYVFAVGRGPIAYVDARTSSGIPVTITQPDGPSFLSPFLTFTGMDGAQPEDYFALPALHRTVQVDYWAGLPARGIDIPFLALRISEQNGGSLFEGVAVSGKTVRETGVALTFVLGSYPLVTEAGAPPLLPFWCGIALCASGFGGLIAQELRRRSGLRA